MCRLPILEFRNRIETRFHDSLARLQHFSMNEVPLNYLVISIVLLFCNTTHSLCFTFHFSNGAAICFCSYHRYSSSKKVCWEQLRLFPTSFQGGNRNFSVAISHPIQTESCKKAVGGRKAELYGNRLSVRFFEQRASFGAISARLRIIPAEIPVKYKKYTYVECKRFYLFTIALYFGQIRKNRQ